ncbi:MAG TPA: Gfo/Idh/MocA family oxidoreductase [Actinocatenispora sp.]
MRVALVGVHGHGRQHLADLDDRHRRGTLELAALCDVRSPAPDGLAATPTPYTDVDTMVADARPDVVVIATPPATHLPIASAALRAGADVLLEKPPVLSLAEHAALAAVVAETGRSCQIGFQSLASPALADLRAAIGSGAIGRVTGVAATGRWVRTDGYYRRAAWAGRRTLRGRPTADGALTNPFAHAVMNCLALVGDAPTGATLELYRARPDIETDDTSCLTLTGADVRCVVAVTLCAVDHLPPRIRVYGTNGRADLEYNTDRVRLPGGEWRAVPGRPALLDNLLAHRADRGVPLLAPLSATATFTSVLAAVGAAPVHPVPAGFVTSYGGGDDRRLVLAGVDDAIETAADRLVGFADQGVAWAGAPPTHVALG